MIISKKMCYSLVAALTTLVLLTSSAFGVSAKHSYTTETLLDLTADFLIEVGVDESEIVDVLSHEELSDEEQLNILFTYVVELSQGDDYSQQYLHLLQDELPATEVATGIVRVLKAFGDAVSGGLEVKVKSNVQANGSKQGWKYCFKCSSRKGGV